ncbi:MAG: HIT domain-containing protein [Holosporales bacterium]|jgi:histidine triad (HIT) family protein|nr:HIT domain-containing protein [Holosporales bacterium]
MKYDKGNVFYKIINKEISSDILLEGEHFVAFRDVRPKAPVHILVVPRGGYVDWRDFSTHASAEEIAGFCRGIAEVIDFAGLNKGGYRLISNSGEFGQQEVFHMHVHILGDVTVK